jgi:hypothetical protein
MQFLLENYICTAYYRKSTARYDVCHTFSKLSETKDTYNSLVNVYIVSPLNGRTIRMVQSTASIGLKQKQEDDDKYL